jgi:hypothetical protein
MKLGWIMVLVYMFTINKSKAQENHGPRLGAMGMYGAAIDDLYLCGANPTAIAGAKTPTLAMSCAKRFVATDLSEQTIAMIAPTSKGVMGIFCERYGNSDYNEATFGSTFTKKFGDDFALGLKLNFHQLKIADYGTTIGFSTAVGMSYQLNKNIHLGLYIDNPIFQRYATAVTNIAIESMICFGLGYQVSDRVLTAMKVAKTIGNRIDLGIGIDYQLAAAFSLRGGCTTSPFTRRFGVGYRYKKLSVDFAFTSHPYLAYTAQIGTAYAL